MAETIHPVSLESETQRRYLNYAVSVISSRALPDVRDGLKPVQRRILYTMLHELHLVPDGRPAKCARIVGDVTGKFHPHSDDAAYFALVRLAQDFVMRERLVIGQGNFGSYDGDDPAAKRYTEAKLAPLAMPLLAELRQRTVEMRPNYDNTREEPVVLPAQYPNLLVNGASGIAVGMATNIPPHNLGEVIRGCVLLIENPEATTAVLLEKIKGPDFPLGGKVVTDRSTLRKIYEEGVGTIKVQGEWKVEELGKGRQQIVITSIPYNTDKHKLEEQIGELIETRKLPQLIGQTNESNKKDGIRVTLELKPGADPNLVMAYLFKHTELQSTLSYNMTCLVPVADGGGPEKLRPERLGLKAILQHFLDFRFQTIRRRFEFELDQLRKRIHILEGFRIVFDALDRAIKIIRNSEGKADASVKLIAAFELTEIQAEAILDAQLYKIASMEIQKILDELKEKTAEAKKIEKILASKKELWNIVKNELSDLGERYSRGELVGPEHKGSERRQTRIAGGDDAPEFDEEAYIVRENTNVVLTRDGWIKRVGRLASVEGTRVREGDEVVAVVPGSTLDHVVFLADDGTAYTMRMNEVPATAGYGEPIMKFFRLADQVKIVGATTTDERFVLVDVPPANGEPAGPYVLAATAFGQVLRVPLAPFRTASNKNGRRYVKLSEGDRVVMASVLSGDEDTMYLGSAEGHVIHFRVSDVNILSGVGKGVMGIKLAKDDVCLGGALMSGRFDKFVLETSGGKTMEFGRGKYEVTSRGGKGFEAVKRASFKRVVPPPIELVDWEKIEEKTGGVAKTSEPNGRERTLFD
jgi:DNA gyrase subunit A